MRPPSATDHEQGLTAGVDIGGTSIKVVLCGAGNRVVARASAPTPAGGPAMISTAAGLVKILLEDARGHLSDEGSGNARGRLLGVGVGAAGVIDSATGTVLAASDSFTDWTGFPVGDALGDLLGVPVRVDNDVNAFLRGEVLAGAGAGATDALGITLGTGVGGALWLDGRLYGGPRGAAGEIGHLPGYGDLPCTCGGHGHLETLASGRSITARYAEVSGVPGVSALEVARQAREGDVRASLMFENAGQAIGRSILIALGLLGFGTVIVGGGVARAWDLLHPALEKELRREPPVSGIPVRVVPAALDADAVAVGAAAQFVG